jgi:hypothetical protein
MDALTFDDVPFERDTEEVAAEKVDYADVSRPSGTAPAQPRRVPAISFDDVPFEDATPEETAPEEALFSGISSDPMGDFNPAALGVSNSLLQRGRQFATGVTESAASVPEGMAITGASLDYKVKTNASQAIAMRQAQIDNLQGALDANPEMPAQQREWMQAQIDALNEGIQKSEQLAVAPIIPARDRDVYKLGDATREAVKSAIGAPDPNDDSLAGKVVTGAGNLSGIVVSSLVASAAGGPWAGIAVGTGVGVTMNQSQVYKEAIEAGVDEETALRASDWAALVGATDIIPVSRALKLLPQSVRREVGNAVMKRIVELGQNGAEEGIQEYLQTVGNNIIAQKFYDPERGWTEDATESALIGSILGVGVGVIGQALDKTPVEKVDDKKATLEQQTALGGDAPSAPPDVDPAMAQAVAGKPVETPGEYAIRVAKERAAAQASAQPAPASPAAPPPVPMAPGKPTAPPVDPITPTVNQQAAPPSAVAGQEPSVTVGVAPTAPPPSEPAAPAPANDLAERAAAAIQESGVTSPYWLGRMLGVSANQAGDVMLQLAQNKRLLEFKNNKFKMLPVTSASNPDVNTLQETEATLAEQQKALVEGKRRTVFYPEGTKPATPPPGSKRTKIEGVGIFDYMSDKITPQEIRAAAKAGRLNELLDLGPFNKQQVAASATAGAAPVAVTERTPGGTEVKAATGTTETAPVQQQVLEATKAEPGNTVAVEDPNTVVAGRQPGRKLGDMLKPYPGEGYRLGPFSFAFYERGDGRYLRVRDRSGNNILQGTDGGEANVDVTDIWSSADPNQYEPRQGNKVGINSLENNVPPQMVGIVRDWLSGKIDENEALARIADQDLDGGQAAAPSAPAATPAPKPPVVETKKPRVLKDMSTASVRAEQEQAEQNEILADRIKGTLKGPKNQKVFKEEAESTGKNWTKAQREARSKIDTEGRKIAEANPPAANEDGFLDPNAGKQTVARAAIRARAEAMVQGAKAAGVTIPDKVSGNIDETMNLGQGGMQLVVARDFLKSLATPYKPVADHYTDFVSRDLRLRNGLTDEVISERRAEIDDKMRRSQGGDIEQIADTRQTVESDAPDNAAQSLDGRDETLSAEQQAQLDDGKTASDTVEMQGDERIVGKDDVETKVSRTAKKSIILMDEERAAKPEPLKEITADKKKEIEEKLRAAGIIMREDGESIDTTPSRPLEKSDILDTYSLADAIAEASAAKGNLVNRTVLNRILQQLGQKIAKTKVLVVDAETLAELYPGRNVDGFYDPVGKHIIFSTDFLKNGQFDAELLAHEGLHAYLANAIDSDTNLKTDIQELLDFVKDRAGNMKGARGLLDVHEFLSEAMSNPRFQNFLMNVEVTGSLASKYDVPGKKTLWSAMVNAIAKHLGISGTKNVDALAVAIRLTERAEEARTRATSQGNATPIFKFLSKKPEITKSPLFSGKPERFKEDAQGWSSAGEAADWLIANSRDEATREIIAKIRPAIENSSFSVVKTGDNVPGIIARNLNSGAMGVYWSKFDTGERALYIRADFLTEEVVAHELLHAATNTRLKEGNLTKNKGTELAQITAEFYDLQRVVVSRYNQLVRGKVNPELTRNLQILSAVSSVEELATYGLTNAKVREFFKSIPYRGGNVYTKFVDNIRRLFSIPKSDTNALTKIIELTERLVDEKFEQDTKPYAADFLRDIGTAGGSLTPMFRERNFGDELRNAGVPNDIAAELEAVLSNDLKDMDDATLAFVMDDLKSKYGTSESNDPTDDQVNKAAGKQADAINKAAEKLQKEAEEFVPRKNPGKRRLLSVKSNYQLGVDSDDYFGKYSNPLRKIAEYIERRRVRKAEILQGLGKVVEKLAAAQSKYSGSKANRAIWENFTSLMNDATMAEVHPDRPLDQQKHLGKDTLRYKWAKAQYPELAARYRALPPDLMKLWQETRDTYTDTQDEMNLGRLSNLLKLAGHPDPALAQRFFTKKATEADKKLIGPRVADLIDDTVELSKIEGPYFPLARRGEWRVQGVYKIEAPKNARKLSDNEFEFKSRDEASAYAEKQDTKPTIKQVYVDKTTNEMFGVDKDGVKVKISKNDTDAEPRWRVTVQNRHVEFANSDKEAKKIADQLRADGLKDVDDVQRRTNDLPNGANADMLSEQMKQLASTLDRREAFSDLSSTQREELRQVLQEVSLRYLGSTRIQSHLIRRRNVEGASLDAVRNANDYVDAASGYIAKLEIQPQIDAAFKEGDRRLAVLGKQGTGAAAGASELVRELKKRAQSSNIDEANGLADVAIRRLTQLAFLRYLASPAYSFFNAMQPNLVALPALAAEYGEGRAVIEMNVSYYDLGGPKMIATGVVDTVKAFGGSEGTDHLKVASAKLKNAKEREMLEELRKIGFIDFDAGMMVARNLQQPDTLMGRTYDPAMAFIDNIGRQAPKAIEALNRSVVALTAYRLAMKKHGSHEKAVQDAKDFVDLTQGTYSQSNQAPVFRSKGGRIALQFKKYGQMMYYNLGRQAGRVIRGMKPGDRKAGFKALAYTLAAHQIAAGTMGLPWEPAKVLMSVLNGLGFVEYDWEDFKEDVEEFYKSLVGGTFAEMLTYGASRGLGDFAFDMSSRVGMDSLLTFGSPKSYKDEDVKAYLWDTAAGASGSMVSSVAKAVSAASNGEWGKFLDALPLKFAVDVSKAVEKGASGDYTVPEAILKGTGLTPASQAREQRKTGMETKLNRRVKSEHDRLFYGYIDAGNDMGKIAKLKGQIREWNAKQAKLPKDQRGQKIRFETVEKRRREELREKAKNKSVDE